MIKDKPAVEGVKYNNEAFYGTLSGSSTSAREVLPLLFSGFKPASILDIGCGLGDWLYVAHTLGVNDIFGVDGEYIDKARLKIPVNNFKTQDLKQLVRLDRKFDMAMSLEVAEHIPGDCADTFVESLTSHADLILFSAAIPGQIGTYHVNEQWPSYWVDKFSKQDFVVKDILRPVIWNNEAIEWWYRQNCLVFIKQDKLQQYEGLIQKLASQERTDLDKVLPVFYERALADNKEWTTSLWTIPKHFANAFRRAFKKMR